MKRCLLCKSKNQPAYANVMYLSIAFYSYMVYKNVLTYRNLNNMLMIELDILQKQKDQK